MCSCHTKLKRGEASNIGPATAELRHEHEVILRALVVLERAGERLAAGTPVDEAALTELVALIRLFADTATTAGGGPALPGAPRGVGAHLGVFLDDHVEGRGYLTTLAGALAAAGLRRPRPSAAATTSSGGRVLFPWPTTSSARTARELARRCAEVEEQVVGPGVHDKLLATLDRLEAAIPGGEGVSAPVA
jgi:hypothetical protein